MNQEERDWLEWLKRVQEGVVTQRQAPEKMGITDRWVRKLLARMNTDGEGVVVHGLRGRCLLFRGYFSPWIFVEAQQSNGPLKD